MPVQSMLCVLHCNTIVWSPRQTRLIDYFTSRTLPTLRQQPKGLRRWSFLHRSQEKDDNQITMPWKKFCGPQRVFRATIVLVPQGRVSGARVWEHELEAPWSVNTALHCSTLLQHAVKHDFL
jgi:hypothetical protein